MRHCRLSKTWDAKTRKVRVALADQELQKAVMAGIQDLGGEVKHGRPPAGGLEDAVAKILKRQGQMED